MHKKNKCLLMRHRWFYIVAFVIRFIQLFFALKLYKFNIFSAFHLFTMPFAHVINFQCQCIFMMTLDMTLSICSVQMDENDKRKILFRNYWSRPCNYMLWTMHQNLIIYNTCIDLLFGNKKKKEKPKMHWKQNSNRNTE